MATDKKANSNMVREKEKVYISIMMVINMKEISTTIASMDMASISDKMEGNTMGSGKTIRDMGWGPTLTQMAGNIQDHLNMVNRMAMGFILGLKKEFINGNG